jgi:hypothetical protein
MNDKEKFIRIKDDEQKSRKSSWPQKVLEVRNSFERAKNSPAFIAEFYSNLFYLKPEIEKYFVDTKWKHQEIMIQKGIEHLLGFLDNDPDQIHHQNILRLSESHSRKNLNIHPHNYYYWIDAMVLTLKELDPKWHSDLEYYTRECLFFPISFMISFYHKD